MRTQSKQDVAISLLMQQEKSLNVLVLREPAGGKEYWVAQCLEYDMVAQAGTIEDLRDKFARLVATNIILALKRGVEPFSNLRPAPDFYWKAFRKGMTVGDRMPMTVPGDRIPKSMRNLTSRIPRAEATMRLAPCV